MYNQPDKLELKQKVRKTRWIPTTGDISFMDPVVFRGDVWNIQADAIVLEMGALQ